MTIREVVRELSDELVLRYLNEAQRLLARVGLVLEDRATPEVTIIPLSEGEQFYPLHKSILQVKAARLNDTDLDLTRVGYDDNRIVPSLHAFAPDYWDVNNAYTQPPGRPARYSVDMGTRTLRIDTPPNAATADLKLLLTVMRLPLVELKADAPDCEPEVPEEFHLELCRFAAGSCLKNTADIDSELRSLGKNWVNDFDQMALDAKRDKQRLQQSPPRFRFRGWVNGDSDQR